MNTQTDSSPSNRQLCYFALVAAVFLLVSSNSHADLGGTLTLEQYLGQVKQGNTATRGAAENSEGERMRASEGQMLLAPTAFANIQYSHDGKPQIVPIVTYDFQDVTTLSLGVSKLTSFGLMTKLSTNLYSINYENASSALTSLFMTSGLTPSQLASLGSIGGGSVNFTTQLELTQSLWNNGFGRATQANQDMVQAQALASSYNNRYAERTSLTQAETSYWNLVTARQKVVLSRDNLDRAQKTYDWNSRRARLQLADRSDELQSQAQLESRRLDYQQAMDDEKVAARAFNTARGTASDEVAESLSELDTDTILAMSPPERAEFRDDVKAAAQQSSATQASSQLAVEKARPTLDAFATLGLNGQDTSIGPALQQSVSMDHPTATVGLRFSAPLDLGTASDTRAGYFREQAAADLNYQRKVFEQEQGWRDLSDRFKQAKHRLQLNVSLEHVQAEKLFHERERYKTGRTTAFQVFTFETDYAQSQIARIQSESDVLGILTQMKLFGEKL